MRTLAIAVAILLSLAVPALAGDDVRLYDAKGRYLGRTSTNAANPRQQTLYDASGRYQGRAMTDANGNARLYDEHGRYLGRAASQPQPPQPNTAR